MATSILRGSGDNEANRKFLALLEKALPEREFVAVSVWLGTFYGFQQNWLLDTWRFALLVKCRQIGGSHTLAAEAVLWGILGEDTSIVSVGQRESDEVLKKVARHLEALGRFGSEWARVRSASASRISLASGGTLFSLPATSGGRGQSGNILLDEAAYFEHPEEVWDGASATVLHGFRMRVCSTPNGVGNLFHNLVRGHEGLGYRLHRVTLEDAKADGLRVDEAECWKMARGDARLFGQLFGGSFLDSEFQYIPGDLIAAASPDNKTPEDGPYFAGLDIGKTVDLTVLTVLRKHAGKLWLVYVETCKRTSSDLLDDMVARAFAKFQLRKLGVDATGLGQFPAERMAKRHGLSKVEPITFTLKSKEELATQLFQTFAERKLHIPLSKFEASPKESPEAVREDVAAIRRIVTPAGNVRYDAPHTDQGHADRAWSLAIAVNIAANAPTYARL